MQDEKPFLVHQAHTSGNITTRGSIFKPVAPTVLYVVATFGLGEDVGRVKRSPISLGFVGSLLLTSLTSSSRGISLWRFKIKCYC